MTAVFDFEMAKVHHRRWRVLLEAFLEGSQTGLSEEEVLYCTDCDLGRWIYDEGLPRYGHLSEMQRLVEVHTLLHTTVEEVVELRSLNHTADAMDKLHDVMQLSDQLLDLLDILGARAIA